MTRPLIRKELSATNTPERDRIRASVIDAREKRMTALPLITCDPQSETVERKLENYLRHVGVEFKDLADVAEVDGTDFNYVVGLTDKSQQNPINKLFGKKCGDASMKAYWDTTGNATWDMASINGSEGKGIYLTQLGKRSDEGAIAIGGMTRDESVDDQFRISWDVEREHLELSSYWHEIEAGDKLFRTDLLAVSKVLRYEGMVVACDCKMSARKSVPSEGGPDYILDEIRKLENSEVEFYDKIPPLYNGNGGLAEVKTPFKNNLTTRGEEKSAGGCFVDIKFKIPGEHIQPYLERTNDVRDDEGTLLQRGTRKGFAELFSGVGGMRFLNTFGGKARANRVLSPVAYAMDDLMAFGYEIVPVSGGYLQYWVNSPSSEELDNRIQRALENRFGKDSPDNDPSYLSLNLRPKVKLIDARKMMIADVRAAFILESLGKSSYPIEILERADFLINFLEHIDPLVKKEIFEALAREENGGVPVKMSDIGMMDRVVSICNSRRTIRDTEDLIWTLRNDPDLPENISKHRDDIENWYFDFAWERYGRIFHLLARKIDEIKENGYQK